MTSGRPSGRDCRPAAEDVVVERLHRDAALIGAGGIPDGGAIGPRCRPRGCTRRLPSRPRSGSSVAQERRRDRVQRHLIGKGDPGPGDVRIVVQAVLRQGDRRRCETEHRAQQTPRSRTGTKRFPRASPANTTGKHAILGAKASLGRLCGRGDDRLDPRARRSRPRRPWTSA